MNSYYVQYINLDTNGIALNKTAVVSVLAELIVFLTTETNNNFKNVMGV